MIRLFNRINSSDPAKRFLLRASNLAGNEINFSNREELFTQQIHFNCTPSRSIPMRITESEGVLNGRYRALIDCLSASSVGTTINDGALMNCRNRIWGGCANWSCRWWQAQRMGGNTRNSENMWLYRKDKGHNSPPASVLLDFYGDTEKLRRFRKENKPFSTQLADRLD